MATYLDKPITRQLYADDPLHDRPLLVTLQPGEPESITMKPLGLGEGRRVSIPLLDVYQAALGSHEPDPGADLFDDVLHSTSMGKLIKGMTEKGEGESGWQFCELSGEITDAETGKLICTLSLFAMQHGPAIAAAGGAQ